MTTTSIKYNMTITGGLPILPPIVLPSYNWSPYIPTYEPQRWIYDTNECSQLGGCITPLEIYFNWLKSTGQLSQAFIDFCDANGYFDSMGSFSFSERFTAIMDGTSINGNIMQNAWECARLIGLLPRSKLNWSNIQAAQYPNQQLMDTSYYDINAVTQDMKDLAQAFLSFASIAWGWCSDGTTPMTVQTMSTALQTSPIALAGPIPTDVNLWNEINVPLPGNTHIVHCYCQYFIEPDGTADILDQYLPWQKRLAPGYPLPIGIIFHVQMLK